MRNYLPSRSLALFSVFAIDADQTHDQYGDCTFYHTTLNCANISALAIEVRNWGRTWVPNKYNLIHLVNLTDN